MNPLLLSGGTVVNAIGRSIADVLIEDGKIAAVGDLSRLPIDRLERVDVTDRLVLPGGVDVHTHLDSGLNGPPTADDFESGTIAAAMGGTTTVVDFAAQNRGQKLGEALDLHHAKAEGRSVIDYGFHMCVTDLYDGALADFRSVVNSGVTSFKVFMAYRGTLMINDGELFDVLRTAGSLAAQVCVHAENGDVIDRLAADLIKDGKTGPRYHLDARPPATEIEAVERAIAIAAMADAPVYFVHLSTEGSVAAVAEARGRNAAVAGETCTHYLTLDPELYLQPGFKAAEVVLTPPLREKHHRDALWRGLNTGDVSIVSSDHCPYCLAEKQKHGAHDFRAIPNGGPGIEHRMSVIYGQGVREGRIGLEKFVELTSTNPAKQFGLFPQKGAIAPGSDADVVVLDPDGETIISAATQFQRMDYTPYEGWKLPGSIDRVYSRGTLLADHGRFVGATGRGSFVRRAGVV